MSYSQGKHTHSDTTGDWDYAGAQVDPITTDQTSSTLSNNQRYGTTQSSRQQGTTADDYTRSHPNEGSRFKDSQQASDDFGQPYAFGTGQQQQQSSLDDPQQNAYSKYDPTTQRPQYSQHTHQPSFGEKLKGNIETLSGQIQNDPQKVAQGEARLRGYNNPNLH